MTLLSLVVFYFILKLDILTLAEVITILKDGNITCVSIDDTGNSAVFVTPPVSQDLKFRNSVDQEEITHWIDDDWVAGNWKESTFTFVTDRRWEHFKIWDRHGFYLRTNAVSFSVCVTDNLKYDVIDTITDKYSSKQIQLPLPKNANLNNTKSGCQWFHYSTVQKNNSLYIETDGNNTTISFNETFTPHSLSTQSNYNLVKLHRYDFKYSSKISSNKHSHFIFTSLKNFCFSMFVSVDEGCYLMIVLKQGNKEYAKKIVRGFNRKNEFRQWEVIEIKSESNGTANISFFRGCYHNKIEGYWAIDDIRVCRPTINVYKSLSVNRTAHVCRSLVSRKNISSCNTPGYLGEGCNVSCSLILGNTYPNCEKHKICLEGKCHCSWGYTGSSCHQACNKTSWGLNCNSACHPSCKSCDSIDGHCLQCKDNFFGENCSGKFPVLLQPPVLLLPTTNHTLTMTVENFEHGKDEIQPDYYQIQYKEINEASFKNASPPKPYIRHIRNENIKITNLITNERVYQVRIILIANNIACKEHVPEMRSPTGNFSVECENNKITINNWVSSNSTFFHFEYECIEESTVSHKHETGFTWVHFKYDCLNYTVKLYDVYSPTERVYLKYIISGSCHIVHRFLLLTFASGIVLVLTILVLIVLTYLVVGIRSKRNKSYRILNAEDNVMLCDFDEEESTVWDLTDFQHNLYRTIYKGLKGQFQSLSEFKPTKPFLEGLKPDNINKNRDLKHFLPYDANRIVLKYMEGVGEKNYINASYIDGYDRPKAYIACQGPKYYTVKDFWRMIWQENVETIVMAGNLVENKKRMCAEYWPQRLNAVFECGKIIIKLRDDIFHERYSCRIFEVCYENVTRTVNQIYLKWFVENEEVFYSNTILPVVKLIRNIYQKCSRPILVHSGYGTGRTGALILCDLALNMIQITNTVDFYSLTKSLREQRPFMVNKLEYYVLAHFIVNEYILDTKNPFARTLQENYSLSTTKQQLDYLQILSHHDKVIEILIHPMKSGRDTNFLLATVPRYEYQRKWLLIKQPKEEDFAEFWMMVAKESIHYILFFNSEFPLWTCRSVSDTEVVQVQHLQIIQLMDYKFTKVSLLIYETVSKQILHEKEVYVYEFKGIEQQQLSASSIENWVKLVTDANKYTATSNQTLLSCSDLYGISGSFVVLSYIFEKYEKELEIDICNAIRIARRSGKKFINTPEQMIFIYACVSEYIQGFDKYQCIPT